MYDVQLLPPVYHDLDSGESISEPVFRLNSQCFLSRPGRPPQLFEEGTEIIWDLQPNDEMIPLNRAAGEAFNEWERSLPPAGVGLTTSDLLEAANLLRQQTGNEALPHEVWQGRVFDLAINLRSQREGRRLPVTHSHIARSYENVPVMTAGEFRSVPSRNEFAAAQNGVRRVRRAPGAGVAEHSAAAGGV